MSQEKLENKPENLSSPCSSYSTVMGTLPHVSRALDIKAPELNNPSSFHATTKQDKKLSKEPLSRKELEDVFEGYFSCGSSPVKNR